MRLWFSRTVGFMEIKADEIVKSKYYKTKLSIKPQVDNLFPYYQGDFPSKKSSCNWPFTGINIMESSKVTLCLGNEIGNLNETDSLKEMWNSKKAKGFHDLNSRERILPLCFRCCELDYVFDQKEF